MLRLPQQRDGLAGLFLRGAGVVAGGTRYPGWTAAAELLGVGRSPVERPRSTRAESRQDPARDRQRLDAAANLPAHAPRGAANRRRETTAHRWADRLANPLAQTLLEEPHDLIQVLVDVAIPAEALRTWCYDQRQRVRRGVGDRLHIGQAAPLIAAALDVEHARFAQMCRGTRGGNLGERRCTKRTMQRLGELGQQRASCAKQLAREIRRENRPAGGLHG